MRSKFSDYMWGGKGGGSYIMGCGQSNSFV